MHILFDSNKLHKFWMSCACKHSLSKDGRNQRKSRPPGTFRANRLGGPRTRRHVSLQQCDMFIRFQNKANISYPVGGPGRHKVQPKDPHVSAKIVKWGNHPSQRQCGVLICNVGETEGQKAPEAGRPASPGPPDLRNQHPRNIPKEPTSRKDQRPSTEGRWPGGTILYRPA